MHFKFFFSYYLLVEVDIASFQILEYLDIPNLDDLKENPYVRNLYLKMVYFPMRTLLLFEASYHLLIKRGHSAFVLILEVQ